jgi:hypothetical protein
MLQTRLHIYSPEVDLIAGGWWLIRYWRYHLNVVRKVCQRRQNADVSLSNGNVMQNNTAHYDIFHHTLVEKSAWSVQNLKPSLQDSKGPLDILLRILLLFVKVFRGCYNELFFVGIKVSQGL